MVLYITNRYLNVISRQLLLVKGLDYETVKEVKLYLFKKYLNRLTNGVKSGEVGVDC